MNSPLIVKDLAKSFTMHLRGGIELPVVDHASLEVGRGECVVLGGPSGIGKSSILKMLYGNYAVDRGQILIAHDGRIEDVAIASPREILAIRKKTLGYVSQFLRTVPRVSALDIVAEPLIARGLDIETALGQARHMLERLNLPETLDRKSVV
jgi:alpha-D-ribose 1-methylphosphonate 5-triphosphate synthase subunit PhnL